MILQGTVPHYLLEDSLDLKQPYTFVISDLVYCDQPHQYFACRPPSADFVPIYDPEARNNEIVSELKIKIKLQDNHTHSQTRVICITNTRVLVL